jgi:hypothetical protein
MTKTLEYRSLISDLLIIVDEIPDLYTTDRMLGTGKIINKERYKEYINELLNKLEVINTHQIQRNIQPTASDFKDIKSSLEEVLLNIIDDLSEFINRAKDSNKISEKEFVSLEINDKNTSEPFNILKNRLQRMSEKIEYLLNIIKENKNTTANNPKKISDTEKEISKKIDEIYLKAKEKSDNFEKLITESSNKINSETESLSELIAKISETGLSKDFSKQANDDKKSADKYRLGAIGLLLLCGIGNVLLFLAGVLDKMSDRDIITKFISLSIFLIPAFYMIKESSKHREQENKNKRISLTLISINSYLSDTNEETKQLVKSTLAREMFSEKESTSSNHIETVNLIKEMKDLFK